jgi:8-oxo-dGTP diphosphatase
MYVDEEEVAAAEDLYGSPVVTSMEYEIKPWEYDVVDGSMYKGRAHDITMFIRGDEDPGRVVVVKKPFFPPGAFRIPSGAANPGEGLLNGALREAKEETGLEIELLRYLVRINARFTSGVRKPIDWTTHIFESRQVGGILEPIDTEEIAEARWATIEELQGTYREALIEAGWDLFRYRVALTDLAVRTLEDRS